VRRRALHGQRGSSVCCNSGRSSAATDRAFPGHGDYITQVWRMKQLEYTWLRSMMGRYEDFWIVTREALSYTLKTIGLEAYPGHFDTLAEAYNHLAPYPDAEQALIALKPHQLAILSNGSPAMLDALTHNSGLDRHFDAVLSVDALKVFKPAPEVYQMAVDRLGVPKEAIGFVSSNCWDALGAKSFGFRVYWINRSGAPVDRLGFQPDGLLGSLGDLPEVLH